MKPCRRVLGALFSVVVLSSVVLGQVKNDVGTTVRVSGLILGPNGPIRYETIRLKLTGKDETITTQTDMFGLFSFSNVRSKEHYDLLMDVPGFTPWTMGVQVGEQDVDLGGLVLQPPRPVSISGRLLGYTGDPMRNQDLKVTGNGPETVSTRTDQEGNFKFPPVPGDQGYSLQILVNGLAPTVMDIDAEKRDVELGHIIIQPLTIPAVPVKRSNSPGRTVQISGRITNENGTPLSDKTLSFENLNILYQSHRLDVSTSVLKTNREGAFVFPAETQAEYEFWITERRKPAVLERLGKLEVSNGQDLDLGRLVLHGPPKDAPLGHLVGPTNAAPFQSGADSKAQSISRKEPLVAAIFVGVDGPVIIHGDGNVVQARQEKEQVGSSSLRIADDKSGAGWLVDSDFCCTSYPLQFMLVVYRPGKSLNRFTSDGRAIFGWKFVRGGSQVAFYQDYPHGNPVQHFELRDVETGRLIRKWDGEITAKSPTWTRGLQ